jgi:hypothetical protein
MKRFHIVHIPCSYNPFYVVLTDAEYQESCENDKWMRLVWSGTADSVETMTELANEMTPA